MELASLKVGATTVMAAESPNKLAEKFTDIPFDKFATPNSVFMARVKKARKEKNIDVNIDAAIQKKESYTALVKVIKNALAAHRKMASQPGASALHHAVVMTTWGLLAGLFASHPEGQELIKQHALKQG